MNDNIYIALALMAGLAIGAVFFGGLWLTIKWGLTSKRPELWIIAGFFIRTGITLIGFYFVSDGRWKRMLACLVGFVIMRVLSKQLLPLKKKNEYMNQ